MSDLAVLRSHKVSSLEDRVEIIKKLIDKGQGAFGGSTAFGAAGGDYTGSIRDPQMRRIGLMVTQLCPPRDDICELKAIYEFIVRNVRYTGDVTGKDTYQSGLRTLQFGGGDCDDHAGLGSVLASVNGFATNARITSNTGASWDHIYLMAGIPKHNPTKWIPLDTTMAKGMWSGTANFGREPPRAKYQDFFLTRLTE